MPQASVEPSEWAEASLPAEPLAVAGLPERDRAPEPIPVPEDGVLASSGYCPAPSAGASRLAAAAAGVGRQVRPGALGSSSAFRRARHLSLA